MERLKILRQNLGVTQEQLADELEVAKSTIGMWENNKREPNLTMLQKIADFFKTSVDYLIGRVDDPHDFFRGFNTNMLPDEILECCNGDTDKALETWNKMNDMNSAISLTKEQYLTIKSNIQFLSYKLGESPEESIEYSGLEKNLWEVIVNQYPQVTVPQLKALAIHFQTTIKLLVNSFIPSGISEKLKKLREEKCPDKLAFMMRSGLSNFTISEIESGACEPDFSTFLKYVKALDTDGRLLIEWYRYTNAYNRLESLTPAEATILEKYRSLNMDGQNRIGEYVDDLVAGGRFPKT